MSEGVGEKKPLSMAHQQVITKIKPAGYIWYGVWGIVFLPLTLGELISRTEKWITAKMVPTQKWTYLVAFLAAFFQLFFWPEKLLARFRGYRSLELLIRSLNILCWTMIIVFLPGCGEGLGECLQDLFSINVENVDIRTFTIIFTVCYVGARQLCRAFGNDFFTEEEKVRPRSFSAPGVCAPVSKQPMIGRSLSDVCLGGGDNKREKDERRGIPGSISFRRPTELIIETSKGDQESLSFHEEETPTPQSRSSKKGADRRSDVSFGFGRQEASPVSAASEDEEFQNEPGVEGVAPSG